MARPQKFYVIWEYGRVVDIVAGLDAAKKKGPSYRAFKSRREAEEFADWWNYDHPPMWLAPKKADHSPKPHEAPPIEQQRSRYGKSNFHH